MSQEPDETMKALIIEGDRGVARLIQTLLDSDGWQVEVCGDSVTAAAALKADAPYDVIVTSYQVPGAYDLELVKLARALEHRKDTPIVMVTGSGSVEAEAFAAGVSEVIHKPFSLAGLLGALRKHCLLSRANRGAS